MPTGGLTGNFATQSTRTLSAWVGQRDVTSLIIADTFEIEDAGASQGSFVATLNERLADLPEVTDQAFVRVFDETRATEMWRGFLKSRRPTLVPTWTNTMLRATDHGELLDRYIPGPISRPVESDAARIGYLWGLYASPLLSPDLSSVDVVQASMPAQLFAGVTLRRALDMIAGQASVGTQWYLDQTGHLHYFSSETNAAPKNVTSDTPAGDEVAPTNLSIDYGDSSYANAIFVHGQTEAGSGWVYDHDEIARVGTQITGDPLDAPDCTTAAMRDALGNMYLGRVAGSPTRGSFTVYSHDADGWRAGQTLDVRSADVGIDVNFRIARVRTRQLAPSSFQYDVEFGNSRRGTDAGGGGTSAVIGSTVTGEYTDNAGNVIFSTTMDATGALGNAFRRFLQSGVFNGDFSQPPISNDSAITGVNPLPYWTFVQSSGTAITVRSVEDTTAASGRVVQFTMAAGAAGDDAYLEQIAPINGATGANWYHLGVVTYSRTGDAGIESYASGQFLRNDGTTTTGSVHTPATTATGALQDHLIQANAGAQPGDAYFYRLRIGLRRAAAATSAVGVGTFHEAVLRAGGVDYPIADATAGKTFGWISEFNGQLQLTANSQSNAATVMLASGTNPALQLFDAGLQLHQSSTAQTISAASDTIDPSGQAFVELNTSGTLSPTMTSTPTISNGNVGQLIVVMNIDSADTITLQDQGTLGSSGLRLSTATYAMAPRDSVTLIYAMSDWIEIARSNVL